MISISLLIIHTAAAAGGLSLKTENACFRIINLDLSKTLILCKYERLPYLKAGIYLL